MIPKLISLLRKKKLRKTKKATKTNFTKKQIKIKSDSLSILNKQCYLKSICSQLHRLCIFLLNKSFIKLYGNLQEDIRTTSQATKLKKNWCISLQLMYENTCKWITVKK